MSRFTAPYDAAILHRFASVRMTYWPLFQARVNTRMFRGICIFTYGTSTFIDASTFIDEIMLDVADCVGTLDPRNLKGNWHSERRSGYMIQNKSTSRIHAVLALWKRPTDSDTETRHPTR